MNDSEIIGKTISKVVKMKAIGHDDSGWLKLEFTDSSSVLIEARYGCYSGNSLGEYPTRIAITDVALISPDSENDQNYDKDWAWKGLEEIKIERSIVIDE